tara:strand:+ start:127 stop:879 length:753 start_codon:yes stop_codon:yes gene_type:complete
MKVAITRVRNEEVILKSTLDRLSYHFDCVIAFDDCSTDGTRDILSEHKLVKRVITSNKWESRSEVRKMLETTQRQDLYDYAMRKEENIDWMLYFDADEHFYFDNIEWGSDFSYYFRLFDVYITPEDIDKPFIDREYIGCEFRDIPMLFRPNSKVRFHNRVPIGINSIGMIGGTVKHFGKGISVEHWEETCDYYINHLNERMPNGEDISTKWKRRKGKAIHKGVSDFGLPLIKWDDRYTSEHIINLNKVDK